MKILIDVNGNAGFDEWFEKPDVKSIIEGLASQGINVTSEEVDYEFKSIPILKKKDRYDARMIKNACKLSQDISNQESTPQTDR